MPRGEEGALEECDARADARGEEMAVMTVSQVGEREEVGPDG